MPTYFNHLRGLPRSWTEAYPPYVTAYGAAVSRDDWYKPKEAIMQFFGLIKVMLRIQLAVVLPIIIVVGFILMLHWLGIF